MSFPGALRDLLESGCSLVVASVGPDLEPHASRAWGLDVVTDMQIRLLVDATDLQLRDNLAARGAIAVTASAVPTLRSAQLKGRATRQERARDIDSERMRSYCDAFFGDVETTDGISPTLMQLLMPAELDVVYVDVDSVFDQTPGPGAGGALG